MEIPFGIDLVPPALTVLSSAVEPLDEQLLELFPISTVVLIYFLKLSSTVDSTRAYSSGSALYFLLASSYSI